MIIDANALFGLSEDHLITHSDGHMLHEAVELPFEALRLAAQKAGFDLRLASSYRSFERQIGHLECQILRCAPNLG